ncbi:Lipid A biosynthesis lauroyl acyltransferase [Candidatus Gullanella endobia]|uniref:Lipid A biosynthesis acyltransferase n=1 Tax=Candidatus Gullanella endobia TaxID=1070130 RepID=A0A143WRF1_9ENTR|nr:Kdo(2)-lipid IV(A) acyltransferase [Candidatus Gullanella endobia]CUX96298.1 Lipid A biosynthesis lauroyl acyltransferase [Candidatus Gullanella endobia]
MTTLPAFNRSFLYPRNWITWLGIGVLYLLVLLPYPLLYALGTRLGRIAMRFMHYRKTIARRNLQLCFPEMSEMEREILLQQNFESVGMGLIETGIAWFWPDWRIKPWISVRGLEHIADARAENKGILLIGMHFLTLELGARIFGMYNPGIGVYRPNNKPLLDWLQTWGRMRSNKSMLDRSNIKGMIRALKNGDIIWYAPDHDYGPKSSVFAPLFAVPQVATTIGTYILVKIAKPAVIPFMPRRLPQGRGYELLILSNERNMPLDSEIAVASYINKIVEQAILLAPDQYMWLHRRFKTRPPGAPSLYH